MDSFVTENDLKGQEVILYGGIPALSYYLQMPSAFNPWSDLTSYSLEVMAESMEEIRGETPVIILENQCAAYLESIWGDSSVAAGQGQAEGKLFLIFNFIRENGYEQVFRNEKFAVYCR